MVNAAFVGFAEIKLQTTDCSGAIESVNNYVVGTSCVTYWANPTQFAQLGACSDTGNALFSLFTDAGCTVGAGDLNQAHNTCAVQGSKGVTIKCVASTTSATPTPTTTTTSTTTTATTTVTTTTAAPTTTTTATAAPTTTMPLPTTTMPLPTTTMPPPTTTTTISGPTPNTTATVVSPSETAFATTTNPNNAANANSSMTGEASDFSEGSKAGLAVGIVIAALVLFAILYKCLPERKQPMQQVSASPRRNRQQQQQQRQGQGQQRQQHQRPAPPAAPQQEAGVTNEPTSQQ